MKVKVKLGYFLQRHLTENTDCFYLTNSADAIIRNDIRGGQFWNSSDRNQAKVSLATGEFAGANAGDIELKVKFLTQATFYQSVKQRLGIQVADGGDFIFH